MSKTILIVEDNILNMKLLEDILHTRLICSSINMLVSEFG